ncbi:MAG: sodium:proton antiporter [Thermoanaerobaculia bacterium]|nr:sodium:proton antiporter [Thermoanaerobaculia bacterium]
MTIPWYGLLPFAALLAAIATFPLMSRTRHLWEKRRFQLLVALALGIPMAVWVWSLGGRAEVVHALVEYGSFITLLLALFVVSGGVFVAGDIRATPRNNTLFLATGAVLASFIGTTGAAMLLVRPLLNTNRERKIKVHTVVFTILVIANCGGLLTPLGDPPLFLGLLRGVPFLWTLNLFPQWLFVNGMLLLSYYALDSAAYRREEERDLALDETEVKPLAIHGKGSIALLGVIVAAVALVPSVDLHAIREGHAPAAAWVPLREIVLLTAAFLSFRFGDRKARFEDNRFEWGPIQEVAALFVGIFLTMVPALAYLGQVAPHLPLNRVTFFLFTGGLSSVLDNAPTYVTFFELAKALGGTPAVAGVLEAYLVSISLGAVFCGAMTYIGNGPNFMVKAIAESDGVGMPSFGGYFAKWALVYLAPILALMVGIFIVETTWIRVASAALSALLAAWHVRRIVTLRT